MGKPIIARINFRERKKNIALMNYCTQLLHLSDKHFIIALMTEPISELISKSISLALHYIIL